MFLSATKHEAVELSLLFGLQKEISAQFLNTHWFLNTYWWIFTYIS